MKWNPNQAQLSLEPGDLAVIAQCKMPVTEMFQRAHHNKNIPPLWSVLSYTMLQRSGDSKEIWEHYRHLKAMAENTQGWYRQCLLPKANGGIRVLSVPRYQLRDQQARILCGILRGLPVSNHAYAYCRGRSIADCARPHTGHDLLIHLDIKDFFGSITEDMVYTMLYRETGYAKSLCRFLARLCCLKGRLPQGAPTSPILSNLVFYPCDEALFALARKHGMHYTRYSDDLFFSGKESTNIRVFMLEATGILLRHGFFLNRDKTKVLRRQHRQSVLGITVNDHPQVSRDYRRKLRQELYYLEKFGPNCRGALELGDYWKYMQQLQGKLSYLLQIDPNNDDWWEAHLMLTIRMRRYARFHRVY